MFFTLFLIEMKLIKKDWRKGLRQGFFCVYFAACFDGNVEVAL